MELIAAIYCLIGIILGMERLSRVTKEDESGMVNMGIMGIIVLWPLYIVYKIWKKRVIKKMK
jgi:FtsH-binding integral membrane protein